MKAVSQPIESILMKEVPCTLQKSLLFCLLQILSPLALTLSTVSQSIELMLMEEFTGILQKTCALKKILT